MKFLFLLIALLLVCANSFVGLMVPFIPMIPEGVNAIKNLIKKKKRRRHFRSMDDEDIDW